MRISTLWLGFGLCGVTVGALVWAQNTRPPVVGGATTASAPKVPPVPAGQGNAALMAKPLPFYGSNHISENLFARPMPPPAKPTPPVVTVKPPTPTFQPPLPPDPFAEYVYSGTVTLGDQRMALLEHSRTKEGQYVKVGEMFHGGIVMQVGPGQVTLRIGDAVRVLPKSLAVNLTPLDKNATFLGGGPTGPGGPGGMPGAGGPGNPMQGGNDAAMQAAMMQAQDAAMKAAMEQSLQMQMQGGGGVITDFMIKDR